MTLVYFLTVLLYFVSKYLLFLLHDEQKDVYHPLFLPVYLSNLEYLPKNYTIRFFF